MTACSLLVEARPSAPMTSDFSPDRRARTAAAVRFAAATGFVAATVVAAAARPMSSKALATRRWSSAFLPASASALSASASNWLRTSMCRTTVMEQTSQTARAADQRGVRASPLPVLARYTAASAGQPTSTTPSSRMTALRFTARPRSRSGFGPAMVRCATAHLLSDVCRGSATAGREQASPVVPCPPGLVAGRHPQVAPGVPVTDSAGGDPAHFLVPDHTFSGVRAVDAVGFAASPFADPPLHVPHVVAALPGTDQRQITAAGFMPDRHRRALLRNDQRSRLLLQGVGRVQGDAAGYDDLEVHLVGTGVVVRAPAEQPSPHVRVLGQQRSNRRLPGRVERAAPAHRMRVGVEIDGDPRGVVTPRAAAADLPGRVAPATLPVERLHRRVEVAG